MKKVSFLFGIHMHQPVDNFDEAVDKAVKLCYMPFFETMMRYPAFSFSVHCSGWLLDTIRVKYPKLFEHMQVLTKKGSIEWLSAGYYEPVLSAIPSRDRRAQIKKLSAYIKKYFKVKPKGLWLTERVWEASLVEDLSACGIQYAMVDDYHFLSNHYDADRMHGYYVTEDNGEEVSLFPISKALRYAFPFSDVEEAVESILQCQTEGGEAAILFDDAEKFGLWPETHHWVYEKKWLEVFLETVLKHEAITVQHYSEYREQNKALGLTYLDNCSYAEMSEWSLKAADAAVYKRIEESVAPYVVKGGIWKNFFIKYHESNYVHKRMLYLSIKQDHFHAQSRDALYRMQTNDMYWHGVFGGFYLPSLRDNAYKYLLFIERQNSTSKNQMEVLDIDKDGYDELKILTPYLSLVFSTKNGAQLIEFGLLDRLFNWQNCIMRREEWYHRKITAQENIKLHTDNTAIQTIHNREVQPDASLRADLIYDWHQKNSFVDHFSSEAFTLERFRDLRFEEVGDFANKLFVRKGKKFIREGGIYLKEDVFPSRLQKKYDIRADALRLKSKFTTTCSEMLYFAEEFNLHFAHPYAVTFNQQTLENGLSLYDTQKLTIIDDFTKKELVITLNQKCNIFAFILHTVSQSENGFEKIAQQISFIFTTAFTGSFALEFTLDIHDV